MAHLIKLEDCVSRYQYDMFRYSSQFSRLKRERWQRLKLEWEEAYLNNSPTVEQFVEDQKQTVKRAFNFVTRWYKQNREILDSQESFQEKHYRFKYKTLQEVKFFFLRELLEFQLKWATTTLRESSFPKRHYLYDETLKWLLQAFPDNYFVAYYPVVIYPKAIVQFDILLIGPTDIWCIVNLNGTEKSIFQSHSERYWIKAEGDKEEKLVNPFLSLNRMSTILRKLMEDTELELSIKRAVITNKGYIDIASTWNHVSYLDQRSIQAWNEKLKNNSSPIKSLQLKLAQSLLNNCQTTSTLRGNYESDTEDLAEFDKDEQ